MKGVPSPHELDRRKISQKMGEILTYVLGLEKGDRVLIINRFATSFSYSACSAATQLNLKPYFYNMDKRKAYEHFPQDLFGQLKGTEAAIGFFDYSGHKDFFNQELGARVELIDFVQSVPIGYAHSPGIDKDIAVRGALQCDYREMKAKSERLLGKIGRAHV